MHQPPVAFRASVPNGGDVGEHAPIHRDQTHTVAAVEPPGSKRRGQLQGAIQVPETTAPWVNWGASEYDLADDGTSIWIGGTGSIVRWNKAQGSYRRYSTLDGLPHRKVLAIAVDALGAGR